MRLRGMFLKRVCVHGAAVAAAGLAGTPAALPGQDPETDGGAARGGSRAAAPALQAYRLTGPPPTIDGLLDEADWAAAMVADGFVVFEPNEGEEPSQATEARVLYGDDALFVGIRAFDTSPDSIVAQLARRDERPHSDWVDVVIDSYRDRRTAFRFGVNPAGVKSDGYLYDDVNEDDSWDACGKWPRERTATGGPPNSGSHTPNSASTERPARSGGSTSCASSRVTRSGACGRRFRGGTGRWYRASATWRACRTCLHPPGSKCFRIRSSGCRPRPARRPTPSMTPATFRPRSGRT